MLNNYLADWEAIEDIDLIKETALQVWGKNVGFEEIKGANSPYPEFVWILHLYGRFKVKLNYDRSTLHIEFSTEEGFEPLIGATEEQVFWGFDGMKPENLLHNFEVLDRVLRKNMH